MINEIIAQLHDQGIINCRWITVTWNKQIIATYTYVLTFNKLQLPKIINTALIVIMALWPPCVIRQAVIFSSCDFFLLSFFFFPYLISVVTDWMSTIHVHMMWTQCKFRMQVRSVLHAAHWKCRIQIIAKNSPSGHHPTTLSGYIFATFGDFLAIFCVLYFQRAARSTFQTCILNLH